MYDPYCSHAPSLTSPAVRAEMITPSDDQPLQQVTRALYVGQTGDVRVRMVSGTDVTFANLQAGTYYPVRVTHVLATGTTATGLVGMN